VPRGMLAFSGKLYVIQHLQSGHGSHALFNLGERKDAAGGGEREARGRERERGRGARGRGERAFGCTRIALNIPDAPDGLGAAS
jgi:hypothetical protein